MLLPLSEWMWPVAYPASVAWGFLAQARRNCTNAEVSPSTTAYRTVVVGNLHSGGSGKTPAVAALAETLPNSVIVSRGYRGQLSREGARVDLADPRGPAAYGDEPWMLAQRCGVPVFIGSRRELAYRRAVDECRPDWVIFDDGFQNFSIPHDRDLVCIKTDARLGEAYCLPLGTLREPLSALKFARGILLIRGESVQAAQEWRDYLREFHPGVPVFEVEPEIQGVWGAEGRVEASPSLRWGIFSGIANPNGFEATVRGLVQPVVERRFADHHGYTDADVAHLLELKEEFRVHHWLTTEKDWHKVVSLFDRRAIPVFYLRIRYVFPQPFWYFLTGEKGVQ